MALIPSSWLPIVLALLLTVWGQGSLGSSVDVENLEVEKNVTEPLLVHPPLLDKNDTVVKIIEPLKEKPVVEPLKEPEPVVIDAHSVPVPVVPVVDEVHPKVDENVSPDDESILWTVADTPAPPEVLEDPKPKPEVEKPEKIVLILVPAVDTSSNDENQLYRTTDGKLVKIVEHGVVDSPSVTVKKPTEKCFSHMFSSEESENEKVKSPPPPQNEYLVSGNGLPDQQKPPREMSPSSITFPRIGQNQNRLPLKSPRPPPPPPPPLPALRYRSRVRYTPIVYRHHLPGHLHDDSSSGTHNQLVGQSVVHEDPGDIVSKKEQKVVPQVQQEPVDNLKKMDLIRKLPVAGGGGPAPVPVSGGLNNGNGAGQSMSRNKGRWFWSSSYYDPFDYYEPYDYYDSYDHYGGYGGGYGGYGGYGGGYGSSWYSPYFKSAKVE